MKDIRSLVPKFRKTIIATVTKSAHFKLFLVALGATVLVLFLKFTTPWNKDDCRKNNLLYGYKFFYSYKLGDKPIFKVDNDDDKCYYEFFEGIHEASTFPFTNYKKLEDICNYINLSYPTKSWNQCYFKLGIASTYTKRDKISRISDLQKFTDEKVKFCEGAGTGKGDCIVGVYTGINIAFEDRDGDSTLPIKDGDPFWLCKVGKGRQYKLQCYRNMVSVLYKFYQDDFPKALDILEKDLSDGFERFELFLTYFSSLAYRGNYNYQKVSELCNGFKDSFTRHSCIQGYATGIDEVAANGTEGSEVLKFCLNPIFTTNERGECIRRGFFELPTTWDLGIKKNECLKMVPVFYRKYCDVSMDMPVPL